jgi:hypothetical protein
MVLAAASATRQADPLQNGTFRNYEITRTWLHIVSSGAGDVLRDRSNCRVLRSGTGGSMCNFRE